MWPTIRFQGVKLYVNRTPPHRPANDVHVAGSPPNCPPARTVIATRPMHSARTTLTPDTGSATAVQPQSARPGVPRRRTWRYIANTANSIAAPTSPSRKAVICPVEAAHPSIDARPSCTDTSATRIATRHNRDADPSTSGPKGRARCVAPANVRTTMTATTPTHVASASIVAAMGLCTCAAYRRS